MVSKVGESIFVVGGDDKNDELNSNAECTEIVEMVTRRHIIYNIGGNDKLETRREKRMNENEPVH